jgi:molecular chaperone GrpE (heat shock protein)
MIFFNKKHEQALLETQHELQTLKEENKNLEQAVQNLNSLLLSKSNELLDGIETHNMSIEDLLEEMDQTSKAQKQLVLALEKAQKQNKDLLAVLSLLFEQRFDVEAILSKQEEWKQSLAMQNRQLAPYMQQASLCLIGFVDEKVSTNLHEVISVVETNDPDLNETVESVLSQGLNFAGVTIKKAKIVARKYRKEFAQHE